MARRQDGTQADNKRNDDKFTDRQQKSERKQDQMTRGRANNYRQNQRGQKQFNKKNNTAEGQAGSNSRDIRDINQDQSEHSSPSFNSTHSQPQYKSAANVSRRHSERYDGSSKDTGSGKYNNRNRRYGNSLRNKPEETIEDIKDDIVRLEKEIELEIKDIRSLKL